MLHREQHLGEVTEHIWPNCFAFVWPGGDPNDAVNGLIARLVPRLQIFFVTLPGQIGLGLLLLAAVAVPITGVWLEAMRAAIVTLQGG